MITQKYHASQAYIDSLAPKLEVLKPDAKYICRLEFPNPADMYNQCTVHLTSLRVIPGFDQKQMLNYYLLAVANLVLFHVEKSNGLDYLHKVSGIAPENLELPRSYPSCTLPVIAGCKESNKTPCIEILPIVKNNRVVAIGIKCNGIIFDCNGYFHPDSIVLERAAHGFAVSNFIRELAARYLNKEFNETNL